MTKIITQNIAGNKLGRIIGGKLIQFKFLVRKEKPDFFVLTETRHLSSYNGKNTFRGYKMAIHDTNDRGTGGVIVFCKNSINVVENSEYSTREGN